jgi:hypothetical protein
MERGIWRNVQGGEIVNFEQMMKRTLRGLVHVGTGEAFESDCQREVTWSKGRRDNVDSRQGAGSEMLITMAGQFGCRKNDRRLARGTRANNAEQRPMKGCPKAMVGVPRAREKDEPQLP